MDPTEPPRPPELNLKEKVTPDLDRAIRRMITQQIEENDPPEVKKTHTHLLGKGHTQEGVMDLLCSILVMELYNVFKNQIPFDDKHYSEVLQEFW
ncbi:MAG: hypothetical protein PVF58_00995 [Candidatus Methanofastidiosia archaeon]